MSQSSILYKPSRLDQAQSRLDLALDNLEHVAANRDSSQVSVPTDHLLPDLEQENDLLKRRNHALDELNQRVSSRLDTVITRLKTALGS
tara:strand:+ start:354 stop:620 length:267 start_codon:yes stop_codon:yes gene_type:complete